VDEPEESRAFKPSPRTVWNHGLSEKGSENPPLAARGKAPLIAVALDWRVRVIAEVETATRAWTRITWPGAAARRAPEAERVAPRGVVGTIILSLYGKAAGVKLEVWTGAPLAAKTSSRRIVVVESPKGQSEGWLRIRFPVVPTVAPKTVGSVVIRTPLTKQ
jgi:hypothetical protein